METQITNARGLLARIENDFFKGVNLAKASLLKGDKRRAFRLLQVERLLTEKQGSLPLAMWLSDLFWTSDEGRVLKSGEPNPLMTLEGQQTLTEDEMNRLRLIMMCQGTGE